MKRFKINIKERAIIDDETEEYFVIEELQDIEKVMENANGLHRFIKYLIENHKVGMEDVLTFVPEYEYMINEE